MGLESDRLMPVDSYGDVFIKRFVLVNIIEDVRLTTGLFFTRPTSVRFIEAITTVLSFFPFRFSCPERRPAALQETGSEQEGLTCYATAVASGSAPTTYYKSRFVAL